MPKPGMQQFVVQDDTDEDNYFWPMTNRNRYAVWYALGSIGDALNHLIEDPDDPSLNYIRNDMPRITRSQPMPWWRQFQQEVYVLADAIAKGFYMAPRNIAQEAALKMASQDGYIDRTVLEHDDPEFIALPEHADDFTHDDYILGEILPALTGDTDVEMLWNQSLDGISDPDDEVNQKIGMGDYGPKQWFVPFSESNEAKPGSLE